MSEIEMTQTEATEEALRLLVRKLRRLHPDTYLAIMNKMPQGAVETLTVAEFRADNAFLEASANGVERTWPVVFADEDE